MQLCSNSLTFYPLVLSWVQFSIPKVCSTFHEHTLQSPSLEHRFGTECSRTYEQ